MRYLTIAAAILAATSPSLSEDLTIDRLVASPSLSGPSIQGLKLSPDGKRITYLQGKADNQNQLDLWEFDAATGERRLLVDSDLFIGDGGEQLSEEEKARRERNRSLTGKSGLLSYFWSDDASKLLFPIAGDIYVLTLDGMAVTRLTETPQFETDVRFSPEANYVSFVRDRELYVVDIATGGERKLTDGATDTVANGMAEFIAQEELGRFTGYWWSPDEKFIAFEQFDESDVTVKDRYEIQPDGSVISRKQRYPEAGGVNVDWRLGVVAVTTGESRWVDLDAGFGHHYLGRVNWTEGASPRLHVQTLDRAQTTSKLCSHDPAGEGGAFCQTIQSDVWVNLDNNFRSLSDGTFLNTREDTGYRHIYHGTKQLTDGEWVVNNIARVDEDAGLVYFTGFKDEPTQLHLYSVPLAGGTVTRITLEEGWHGVTVGDGLFIDQYSSPTQPPMIAVKDLSSGETQQVVLANTLDSNHPYAPYLDGHVDSIFGTLKAADGETDLYYRLYLPAGFDRTKQYPAIMAPYGGPHGQRVRKLWSLDFNQVLARQGYVVMVLDNRGMWNRGLAFESVVKNNMGRPEISDQVAGVNWLKAQGYVDGDNVGMWGWSYGGYMTLMALFREPDVFKAGVSVAPVTDWRLYDTGYTERYLSHPEDDGNVYEDSSVFKYIDGFSGDLLLMHGMADDNVFFDNSVKLMSALQVRKKPFELMTYPGKKHGIRGEATRAHLWTLALDFFDRKLKDKE